MNSLGLTLILKMGCLCTKESIVINDRRYYLRAHLGDGGFSTVHLVEDELNHKLYALKRITCHSPEDQKVGISEVEYYKALSHPNIIECVDWALIGKSDLVQNTTSEVLILLPYYQRGTLSAELERRSSTKEHILEPFLLDMFRQICEGVKAMHEAKPHAIAHRDLKTANILLTDDYTPIIMDFGSAGKAHIVVKTSREARQLQDQAAEKSSMPYRAPELFNIESTAIVNEKTDIWSLGCVLYAMCFFKSPFDLVFERGDSVALAVVSAIIDIPESSPYSQGLHKLILDMLKVNPEDRPYIQNILERTIDLIVKSDDKV